MYDPRKHIVASASPNSSASPRSTGVTVSTTGVPLYVEYKFKQGRGYNSEFEAALKSSIDNARLFDSTPGVPAGYRLVAEIDRCDPAGDGVSMTASVEITYTLSRISTDKILWKETIETADTRGSADSITGAYRAFIALNAAFRKNIEAALAAMGELTWNDD